MEEARHFAAQCWCDDETKDRTTDPALAEAVARRIAAWMDVAAMHSRNEDFYRTLLDRCVDNMHPSVKELAFTCQDGSKSESPLRLTVPHCVSVLTRRLHDAELELECAKSIKTGMEE